MKFTQIPVDTFQKLQLNAGILVDSFTPATGVIGNILGATTGGISFSSNPTFSDFGEDIDNCPNNMKELKRLESYDPQMTGNFLTCSPSLAKKLCAAADIAGSDATKVIPRNQLLDTDFTEVWWIGDYSDVNTGDNAGYLAIRLMNALNQSGFAITTGKNEKGQLAFEFHGHYSIDAQDTVPFEIYCKSSSGALEPSIMLNLHTAGVKVNADLTLKAIVVPSNATVTWSSGTTAKATVSNGVVHGVAAGSAIITAAITVDGVTYNDTCTVIVTSA